MEQMLMFLGFLVHRGHTTKGKSNQLGIQEEWGKLTFPYSFLIEKKERRINQKVSFMILSKGLLLLLHRRRRR